MSDSNELKWYQYAFAGVFIIFAAIAMTTTAVILVLVQPKLWLEAFKNEKGK